MKHLLKIISVGIVIWLLSLIWLEINLVLMWPLFAGMVGGMVPAYFLGRSLRQHRLTTRPRLLKPDALNPTRPTPVWPSAGPTRPSQMMSVRARAARPTRPMLAL